MEVNRTTIFAALLAAGLATGAIAQPTAPGGTKPGATAGSPAAPATPAPPSTGTTGMDKGAGTGAATGAKSAAAPSLSSGERRFIESAGQEGRAEVEIAKLALQKAESPQAKELAQRLVDDHTKANAELTKLASAKGVTVPAEMDRSSKRLMDKLGKKSGNAFDREFTDETEDGHTKEVREFRSMAKSAKDPDVKAFAASTLTALEQHLQMAKSAESAVKSADRERRATTAATGDGPSGTAKSTAAPGKDTAATTGTAGPGAGMPASSAQSAGTAPQAPGGPSDKKTTSPAK